MLSNERKKYVLHHPEGKNPSCYYQDSDTDSHMVPFVFVLCLSQLMEEKDELQMAYNKCNLAQSKLQSLCRELQRHCKAIKVCGIVCVLHCSCCGWCMSCLAFKAILGKATPHAFKFMCEGSWHPGTAHPIVLLTARHDVLHNQNSHRIQLWSHVS